MKKNLLKTALAAFVMALGTTQTAWADETTVTPTQTTTINPNNAETVCYDATATSWRFSQSTISNGAFKNSSNPVLLTKFDASSALESKNLVKATFKFTSICTVASKSSKIYIAKISTGWDATTATWSNTNKKDVLNASYIGASENNVGDKTATEVTIDVTDILKESEDSTIGFALYTYTAREQEASNLSLVIEAVDASTTANYTVKFVDGNGNEVKTAETRIGQKDAACSVTEEDKASFYNTDKTKKYIYDSDDASSKTIAEDGTTVVTVKYREAAIYSYTLKAVDADGNELKEILNGTVFEGETSRVYYPKAVNVNGQWYMTDGNKSYPTYGIDFSSKSDTTIAYKKANIAYYADVEDINVSRDWAATGAYPERYSGGKAGRLYKGAYAYTDAFEKTKTYTLYMWARNNASSSAANVVLGLRDSEGAITELENAFEDWAAGKSELKSVASIEIPAGSSLVFKNGNAEWNSNLEMDYIYLVEELPASETISVSSAQYATYATNYNVVVPESGVKVYTVKVNNEGTAVEKTEVAAGTVIPAGTGILVSAEEGSYDLSVTSDGAATIENNDLVAATSDVTSDGASYYALAQKDGKVGFALVATDVVIPAGKAYLKVENASGAKFISMTGELTVIDSVAAEKQNADGAYYTLQGVKTAKPTKGMYIHNGKKVIVK